MPRTHRTQGGIGLASGFKQYVDAAIDRIPPGYPRESAQRMSSMNSSLALTNLASFKVVRNVVAKNL